MIISCSFYRMKTFAIIFPLLFITVHGSGEFSVIYSPTSVEFKGNDKLDTEFVGDVVTASLGYSVPKNVYWPNLYLLDPFNLPKVAVVVYVEGVKHLNLNGKETTYETAGSSVHTSLDGLTSALGLNSLVIDLDLSQGSAALLTYTDILGEFSVPSDTKAKGNLKPTLHSEDKLFLQQIAIMQSLAEKLDSIEKKPTLITLRVSLGPIASAHGETSPAMSEAIKLLSDSTKKLAAEAEKTFKNDLIFIVVTDKADDLARSKRETEKEKEEIDPSTLNLATFYSEDYPVIFNIILWFGVVFAFSLLAISYAIATMDPGRDSIIYRMTSTRMKKDN